MKKFLGILLVIAIIVLSLFATIAVSSFAYKLSDKKNSVFYNVYGEDNSDGELRIVVKGSVLSAKPVIVDGNTLMPLRAIFEALGAEVEWDAETKTALGSTKKNSVKITVDSSTGYVNNKPVSLAQPAIIADEQTLVPARFIAEALGADVDWNPNTKTVVID